MTDLYLKENEVLDYVKGSVTNFAKEQTQALVNYNKDETRAQRILIESIKDPLIPYVSKLKHLKKSMISWWNYFQLSYFKK